MDFTKPILRAVTLAKTKQTHANQKKTSELAKEYSAHITGDGIADYLKRYTVRESEDMFKQRVAITNSINPAVASSLMKPFYKVSRNNNIVKKYDFKDVRINEKIAVMLNDFNGEKVDDTDGFEVWLKTRFVELSFADPNGFVVIEWEAADVNQIIKPRPFEVSSEEVLNYEYKGAELQWLFINTKQPYFKITAGKTETVEGEKFTLYGVGYTITIEQCDKLYREENGLKLLPNQQFIEWQNNTYILSTYETKLGFVPAFRVGYARDLSTKGKTFVNPFNPALTYFRKALKTTSELDITMTGHVFPQKLQYIQPCQGVSTQETCFNGKNPQGGTCAACNGTGFKTVTTAQEAIYLPMPEDPKELIPLDQLLVYKAPPIELVKFQNDYVKELKQDAHLAVYNSNMFLANDAQFAKTATEIDSNMEGVYDAIEPFTEKYSKVWKFVVYTCAVLSGFSETRNDFELIHTFPADPKLKTISLLLADLKAVNESNAPSFMRDVLNRDIAEIVFNGDEEALLKFHVRRRFYPFNGKTMEEISQLLSTQYVSELTKILYANFEAIFTEIEKTDAKFYQKKYDEQWKIVDEMVIKWKEEILANEPMKIDFSTGASGAANAEQNNGANPAGTQGAQTGDNAGAAGAENQAQNQTQDNQQTAK